MLRSFVDSSVKKGTLDSKNAEKMIEELSRVGYTLVEGYAAAFLPCKSHEQDSTAYLFIFFPLLLLSLRSWVWDGCFPALPVQLYQDYLSEKMYLGLTEAIFVHVISLTWEIEREPDCAQKQKGVQLFLKWAIMQGVQNRYQRKRLYTRIALGKARRMDVVWGETAGVEGQLWLLCPMLFMLQVFEAYVGVLLLKVAMVGVISEWQVVTCGILFIVMVVGNFANTVETLLLKCRFKAKTKKSKETIM
ncbi:hypothetical protein L1987_23876 [Smallanthus sonchifolius]|uniref:Uncharacterized protein n=1 Tax=Smallanthus sonchifolius TaxID=185202 RepID=A0ACB9II49_9ASTR|nr:hypothetical protein L1987_23876 [Smallanthus sonchifolius]